MGHARQDYAISPSGSTTNCFVVVVGGGGCVSVARQRVEKQMYELLIEI